MSNNRLKWIVLGVWGLAILAGGVFFASGTFDDIFGASFAGASSARTPAGPVNAGGTLSPEDLPPTAQQLYPTFTPFAFPTLEPFVPKDYPIDFDPLTGLTVVDPGILNRRPIAVKVVNYPRSVRPNQSGLTLADVIYEHYIEDGITRYVAIFYSHDASRAGPVRSGRFIDEHLMRMYQAVLVFANMDDRVQYFFVHSDLNPYLIVPVPANCPPVCRDQTIQGFNNVFVDTSGIGAWLKRIKTDNGRRDLRSNFYQGSLNPWDAPPANIIFVRYSGYAYTHWEYDPDRQQYMRYQDTADSLGGAPELYAPLLDAFTGRQVFADNLVVLFVPHSYYNKDDQVFEIDLSTYGDAILFREGRAYKGRWVRPHIDQPIVVTDPEGLPFALKPGLTFYEVLTQYSTYTSKDDAWRFKFVLPP
jgi:hypothetical protein